MHLVVIYAYEGLKLVSRNFVLKSAFFIFFLETGHDPAVHGARLEDRYYNNDSFKVKVI